MSMFNSTSSDPNTGVHLHALIEKVSCGRHNVPEGVPCYHIPNDGVGYNVGACGTRIKKAGFIGKISPQSMRAKAPGKPKDGPNNKKTWVKKPNVHAARTNTK